MNDLIGIANHGTGDLITHRWRLASFGYYLSFCGMQVTKVVEKVEGTRRCKKCFKEKQA